MALGSIDSMILKKRILFLIAVSLKDFTLYSSATLLLAQSRIYASVNSPSVW
jgi:hypothetical protein